MTGTNRARRYLVVLVDRQASRLVRAGRDQLEEEPGPSDPVERQVDTDVEVGSWERRHQEAFQRHLRRVAAAVTAETGRRPVEAVVVGGPPEAVEVLVPLLAPGSSDAVVTQSGLTIRAGRAELLGAIVDLDRRLDDRHQDAVCELLAERIGTGRGAGGLEAALDALADGRVATLVVKPGYSAVGVRCPTCGHLGVGSRPCPRCGSGTEAVEDVVGAAVEQALAQNAAVEFCSSPRLDELGGMGVVERY